MVPKALIFDCDGTLADTMPLHWRAWQVVAGRYHLDFPEDRFYSLGGVPSRDILKMLSQEQGKVLDPLAVSKEKEAAYIPFLSQVEEIKEVADIARKNYGIVPMAVASGGMREHIDAVLTHLGLRRLF
jgi:beta-phosphoglucomutase-like phosphatase (HAD superfamily)